MRGSTRGNGPLEPEVSDDGMPEDVKKQLIRAQERFLENNLEHLDEIMSKLTNNNIPMPGGVLGNGANNRNYKVSNLNNHDVAIQFCRKSPAGFSAYSKLTSHGRPNWLPHELMSLPVSCVNQKGYEELVILTVMEFCPQNLADMVKAVAANENNYETRIAIAMNIGTQLSDILSTLSENDVVWTDLKPGNIMLRNNGEIVITDTKAIQDPQLMTKHKRNNNVVFNDVSNACLSEYFRINCLDKTMEAKDVRPVWEREYSYQMAVQLHYIATATEMPRSSSNDYGFIDENAKTSFDFSHKIFATEQGLCMKYLIERLGEHDPQKRMAHTDAKKLLSVMNNPNAFNAMKKDLYKVRSAATKEDALKRQKNSREIDERLAREKQRTAFAKFGKAVESVTRHSVLPSQDKNCERSPPRIVFKRKGR